MVTLLTTVFPCRIYSTSTMTGAEYVMSLKRHWNNSTVQNSHRGVQKYPCWQLWNISSGPKTLKEFSRTKSKILSTWISTFTSQIQLFMNCNWGFKFAFGTSTKVWWYTWCIDNSPRRKQHCKTFKRLTYVYCISMCLSELALDKSWYNVSTNWWLLNNLGPDNVSNTESCQTEQPWTAIMYKVHRVYGKHWNRFSITD